MGLSNAFVVWDFNGTILDDASLCIDILNRMLSRRGLPSIGRDRYLDVFRFPISDAYRLFGFDFDVWPYESLAREFMEEYMPASMREIGLRDGVGDALSRFAQAGLQQVLLSASNREYLVRQITHFGIAGFFEELLGLDDPFGNGKAGIGRRWADRIRAVRSVPPCIVMIGDTDHDREVAEVIGAGCVLVGGGHCSRARLLSAGADAVADDVGSAAAAALGLLQALPPRIGV
ncbi:MAG: HAD family hydrolase [Clostridia bacterium]|nr:HAD family hydrolase [Clostridia bacterium]